MTNALSSPIDRLQIAPEKKTRRKGGPLVLALFILLLLGTAVGVFLSTRRDDREAVVRSSQSPNPSPTPVPAPAPTPTAAPPVGDTVLTVSGYIIPRERIEISPKFVGTVTWIGVKKGDQVKKDQVIVRLEDNEYQARVLEALGRLAAATASLTNAEQNLARQLSLSQNNVESQRALDDARLTRDAAAANLTSAQGQLALVQTYLDWCTIRAPIDGTILEKLVDPNELVSPQSFGGSRGPSTAFVAMANLADLQVEIDLNEADLSRVRLQQRCRVVPEAYPDKRYAGRVVEIAPEANRSKGTLQVKVQIENPDQFLTPELSAKVDFLKE